MPPHDRRAGTSLIDECICNALRAGRVELGFEPFPFCGWEPFGETEAMLRAASLRSSVSMPAAFFSAISRMIAACRAGSAFAASKRAVRLSSRPTSRAASLASSGESGGLNSPAGIPMLDPQFPVAALSPLLLCPRPRENGADCPILSDVSSTHRAICSSRSSAVRSARCRFSAISQAQRRLHQLRR